MSESASGEDAVDQLDGIDSAQRRARQQGVGDDTIQSTKKSEQNVDNRNRRIKSLEDALEEYGDDDVGDE